MNDIAYCSSYCRFVLPTRGGRKVFRRFKKRLLTVLGVSEQSIWWDGELCFNWWVSALLIQSIFKRGRPLIFWEFPSPALWYSANHCDQSKKILQNQRNKKRTIIVFVASSLLFKTGSRVISFIPDGETINCLIDSIDLAAAIAFAEQEGRLWVDCFFFLFPIHIWFDRSVKLLERNRREQRFLYVLLLFEYKLSQSQHCALCVHPVGGHCPVRRGITLSLSLFSIVSRFSDRRDERYMYSLTFPWSLVFSDQQYSIEIRRRLFRPSRCQSRSPLGSLRMCMLKRSWNRGRPM